MDLKNKKVIFLTSSAPRFSGDGTAPFILNMAQDLTEIGWHVDILAPHAENLKKVEKIGNVTIYRFSYCYPFSKQTLCYHGGVNANLRRSKFNYLHLPLFIVSQFFAAYQLMRKNDYVLIHSHWLIPQGVIGFFLSKVFSVPHVSYAHGSDIFGLRSSLLTYVKKRVLRASDAVITNSSYSKQALHHLAKEIGVHVIPTGATPIDMSQETVQSSLQIINSSSTLRLIFVGRLTEEKGLIYLLEALPILLESRIDFVLEIIGDGINRSIYEQYVLDKNLGRHVKFLGMLSQTDVFQHLIQADILIGPSIITKSSTEAQGNVFVEAMFCKTAVIASNIGGIPDAVIHEKTGLLVAQQSANQIAHAIIRLKESPDLVLQLTNNALAHATEHFSRYQTAVRLSKVYHDVL